MQDAHDDIHQDAATHGNANRLPKGWTNFNTSSSNGPVEQQQQPLVSIVLPVYNGEAFLQECLHSITMQSHRPLELAVCDNGSTDSTPIILAAWRPKLEAVGIQYVCVTTGDADPRGCGYGRNRCIEAASGASSNSSNCCIFFIQTCVNTLTENASYAALLWPSAHSP